MILVKGARQKIIQEPLTNPLVCTIIGMNLTPINLNYRYTVWWNGPRRPMTPLLNKGSSSVLYRNSGKY
jgi:hypothetical protein